MLHKTKGIVLKNIHYGETSCIVTIFTALFGVQSYLINGVRTTSKSNNKAIYFQPGCLLDLVVYHNQLKKLQRIKEFKFSYLYISIMNNVYKNAIALYMVELLQKCLHEPETNVDLYYHVEGCFIELDNATVSQTANYSLYYTMVLAKWLGFGIDGYYSSHHSIIDLKEGKFTETIPHHNYYLDNDLSSITYMLLKVSTLEELGKIQLSKHTRRDLLKGYEDFFRYHIADFTSLRSLSVLYVLFD